VARPALLLHTRLRFLCSRGRSVILGDIRFGEQNEVVVELATSATKDGAAVEALDAVLQWDDSTTGERHEERVFVGAKATNDHALLESGKDESVANAVARARDAAATLQRIEQERAADRATKARPTTSFADEAAPLPSPVAGAPRRAPEEVKREHNEAMRRFQSF
jgi:hypothetical protein